MSNLDEIAVGGELLIEIIRDGKNGPEVIHSQVNKNLVVNVGKKKLMSFCVGGWTKTFDHFRLGKGATAAASNQTNVLTAIASTNKTVTTLTVCTGRTYYWMFSYVSGGGSLAATSIQELAILSEPTTPGGSMLARVVISPKVNKTTNDKLKLTYKCRVT